LAGFEVTTEARNKHACDWTVLNISFIVPVWSKYSNVQRIRNLR